LRAGEGRILRRLKRLTQLVNGLEPTYEKFTDEELKSLTSSYRERYAAGETLDELLPEAFATVREASKRVLGQRHFDVQIMGGAALHLGNIAEMKTGEGKTLVSTLPAYLNAISGLGVHIVTVNDYLAARDSEWMGRIHRFLGLEVGVILANMDPPQRRLAYQADITYGTNNEFGFDYLRDNMSWNVADLVQRGHNFAIVDEVDSILIDEARTPLIISGPTEGANRWYSEFSKLVAGMQPERDYEVDIRKRTVGVLEPGIVKVEDALGIENLYESANTPLIGFLNNALRAKELYLKDRDYVVIEGQVLIVDEHTGRILHGRRYNEGLHQAIEAKEGVQIQQENQTLATITLQNYFRLYQKLAGMTGTAMTEASEFDKIYKLGVVPIPTNMPMVRKDETDLVFRTEEAKFHAVVEDITDAHRRGQPVLIGTTSVEKSEYLSKQLTKKSVPHSVLNAKQHEKEAAVIAQAGHKGAVTVATNMAGRGTDIMLGGNPEFLAAQVLASKGVDPGDDPVAYQQKYHEALGQAQKNVASEREEVLAAGGLYVLGTERHESRRIDNQLRGRSGRQGDPGRSRFYLSLQDDIMRRFKADLVDSFMRRFNVPDDVPIEAKMVTGAIKGAQTQVEQQNFEVRKNVLKYDEVLNRQRQVIYAERRRVLQGEDISGQIRGFLKDTITGYVTGATTAGFREDWNLDQLWAALGALYPVSLQIADIEAQAGGELDQEILLETLLADAERAYQTREQEVTPEVMREIERQVVLSVLDRKWREHLYEMDYLQEGIGLRAMGQRDPLVEYQREGYDLFMAMMDSVKEEVVGFVFHAQLQQPTEPQTLEAEANGQAAPSNENVSRNDPCPCGSGKKYKRCHGDPRNAGKSSTNYQTAASPL
jgi:preprotein translocase subunit SecA